MPKASLLRLAMRHSRLLASLRLSLVVGSLLNLINQGETILAGSAPSWPHLALNYLVPFCVASYSAARNEAARNEENTQ